MIYFLYQKGFICASFFQLLQLLLNHLTEIKESFHKQVNCKLFSCESLSTIHLSHQNVEDAKRRREQEQIRNNELYRHLTFGLLTSKMEIKYLYFFFFYNRFFFHTMHSHHSCLPPHFLIFPTFILIQSISPSIYLQKRLLHGLQ